MNNKSSLWTTLERNPQYSKTLVKALENYQKLPKPEVHDGVGILEMAVFRCTDVKVIKYMIESKFWHIDGEPFSFRITAGAVLNPNEKVLEYLITKGLVLVEDSKSGFGPLHIACADNENPKVIKAILNTGADVNLKEIDFGLTPFLMAASRNPNPQILKLLKKAGADLTAKTNLGRTALHLAVLENPNPDVIDELIDMGLDVNAEDYAGCNPFMYAVTRSDKVFYRSLMGSGARLLVKDKKGQSPLFYASYMNSNPQVLKDMLNIGYPVNEKNLEGRTPLMYSSLNSNDEIAEMLIKNGADVNAEDLTGKKAFCYVLEVTKSVRVVRELARLSNFANDESVRWLFLAAVAGYNNLKMLNFVMKLGAELNLKNRDDRTVLHFVASVSSNPKTIKFLVKSGLDVNELDDEKATPFLYAVRGNKSPEVLQTLIELGANPTYRHNDYKSALHIACEQNPSEEVILYLLKSGLYDVNEKDEFGLTPFLCATANPNPNIIKILADFGADTKVTDLEGNNALIIAGSNAKTPEIIEFLIDSLNFKVDAVGKSGFDSIFYASLNNTSVEILDCLVRYGAKLDRFYSNGLNLLMIASRFNLNPEIVKYLVAHGIDINLRSKESVSCFEEIQEDNRPEIVKELEVEEQQQSRTESRKTSKYEENCKAGTTAIMQSACNINIEVLEALIECGANVYDQDKEGRNLLSYAASANENPKVPKYLISKFGFRTNRKDENGTTAVFDASMNPCLDTLKSILECGGDLEAVGKGGITPLMTASMGNSNAEVIRFLLEEGLSVHDTDETGMTPLLYAAYSNENPEICEVLITAGASIFDVNSSGSNALALAKENKNPMVYQILSKYASMDVSSKEEAEPSDIN